MVVAVIAGLQGEAAEWVADLYTDHARELADTGPFLETLQSRFEDVSQVWWAEGELLALKQQGCSTAKYIHEFQRVAGRLRSWPERLLVHQFWAGLDQDLHQACVFQGIPSQLQDWFRVVGRCRPAGILAKGGGPIGAMQDHGETKGQRTEDPGPWSRFLWGQSLVVQVFVMQPAGASGSEVPGPCSMGNSRDPWESWGHTQEDPREAEGGTSSGRVHPRGNLGGGGGNCCHKIPAISGL